MHNASLSKEGIHESNRKNVLFLKSPTPSKECPESTGTIFKSRLISDAKMG